MPRTFVGRAKENALNNPPCLITPTLTSSSVHYSSQRLQRFFRITMSPKRVFVPKSDVKLWFTTTTTTRGCSHHKKRGSPRLSTVIAIPSAYRQSWPSSWLMSLTSMAAIFSITFCGWRSGGCRFHFRHLIKCARKVQKNFTGKKYNTLPLQIDRCLLVTGV